MDVADFDYDLPPGRIAQSAIEPRHDSRLLVVERMRDIPFRELATLLRPDDCLVVNTTRVRHARLRGTRVDTGGGVEVLLTRRVDDVRWEALLRPARRLRAGIEIRVGELLVTLLTDPSDGLASVRLEPSRRAEDLIRTIGEVPLPPYFTGDLPDAERYQTIFARAVGSAAAPTASLHFTDTVVGSLHRLGVSIAPVELQVGLDTFRPMSGGSVADHEMHSEHIVVDGDAAAQINDARSAGGRIVAVGTTVVRTLESVADATGVVEPYAGPTDLFITPGYHPRIVDAVITNFHAPRSTLLVLIAALMGPAWRDVYRHALDQGFRFLSFGDAMFFEVHRA